MNNLYRSRAFFALLLKLYCQKFTSSLFSKNLHLKLFVIIALLFNSQTLLAQPSGFVEEEVGGEWNAAVGLTFSKDGKSMFVWEKAGKVWIVENGERLTTPLLDISEEVGNWGDHGLLGFTLDPNFESNGYVYALYVVDRHHLMNFGTGAYNPSSNEYYQATIGRVTRFTASNRKTVDKESRKVLLGKTAATGVPILYESHGIGTLIFGEDGNLLISTGDGATAGYLDIGFDPSKPNDTYVDQALKDGIISKQHDVGAFRVQQVESLNGKILRINPETGYGIPSNPFYNTSDPDAPESKVWALGLRNPFRFTLRPGSGSANSPGVLYIGDSGWQDWEEVNVATEGGMNFGWPIYEGLEAQRYYSNTGVDNPLAPNPLFGQGNCNTRYFTFHNLLKSPKRTEKPYYYNPCDYNKPIPDSFHKFIHARPELDWVNAAPENGVEPSPNARTGIFDGEEPAVIKIGTEGSSVIGPQFYGSSSTGGFWYTGDDLPAVYKNTYFFGDYGAGWIRNASFDGNNELTEVRNFINDGANVVAFATNPVTGGIYYINYATQIKRVAYYGSNIPPKAVAKSDKIYGSSPLEVHFKGSESSDTDGQSLTYEWDFGDGSPKVTQADPVHTFTTSEIGKKYFVKLKVTDSGGLSSSAQITVSVNNTPPTVKIVSPAVGTKYSMADKTVYDLRANVTDNEHNQSQLTYEWQTTLHHNTHVHPEPIDNSPQTTATITPIGCDSETYFYRISLKVTDPGGLSATDHVDIYPACSAGEKASVRISAPNNNSNFALGDPIPFSVSIADENRGWAEVVYYQGSTIIGSSKESPFKYIWNNASKGSYSITVKAFDKEGHFVLSDPIIVNVGTTEQVDLSSCLPGLIHYFGFDGDHKGVYEDFASSTAASCATCPKITTGKFKQAQSFGEGSTGLNINNFANFNWGKNANFTISFWMRSDAQTNTNSVIVGRNAINSKMHWWIGLNPKGQAMFMLRDVDHVGIYIGEKGPSLNDGKWHKLTAVRDGANKKSKLFVDGVLIDEAEYFYEKGFEGQAPVNVGYMQLDHGYHYKGLLDELKIYNRALLQDEVVASYNNGDGTYCVNNALGLEDNKSFTGSFEVFPNPNNGDMRIYLTDLLPGEHTRITLTDATGKIVAVKEVVATHAGILQAKFDQSLQLKSGLYNLILSSPERSLSRKVVVVH